MARWTAADIPDQTGRTIVVTGANSGLGAVTATELARAGARVVVACRDIGKGERAAAVMAGSTEVRRLDLADLASVREFAAGLGEIAVLVNNAGVMATLLRRTRDGFELQIGTNHLGHFALTGLLLDRISDRVVTVSSGGHRLGRIHLDDLNWEQRRYQRWLAYGQAKLANLQSHTESIQDRLMSTTNRLLAQSAQMGALPTLYAATVAGLPGGSYIGPDGPFEQRGYPKLVHSNRRSHDDATAAGLWTLSQTLTRVTV